MSDRWDADLTPDGHADGNGSLAVMLEPNPPTIVQGPDVPAGPLTYGLIARIALNRPAFGFRVEHDLPMGVELVEARPRATVVGEHLIWQMGRIDPGQEVRLEIIVRPLPGAVLDPTEMANFTATYSQNLYFQAPFLRPRLSARVSGPTAAEVGTRVEFVLDVANTGNWVVADARANVILPPEFQHPSGSSFRFNLGTLQPKEYRRVTVSAQAVARGSTALRAELTGPGEDRSTVEFATRVTGPALDLKWHGPTAWKPREDAPVRLTVRNSGDALAWKANVSVSLPSGMKLVSSDGLVGPDASEVLWPLGDMAAGDTRTLTLSVRPVTPGVLPLRATATANGVSELSELIADVEPDSGRATPVLDDFLAGLSKTGSSLIAPVEAQEVSHGEPHLVFALGDTDYAVPLAQVREVGRPPACTPLPNVPDWLLGVANVRGDVVSLVDLRIFLDGGSAPAGTDPRLLVVATADTVVALVVDRVRGLRNLSPDRLPVPTSDSANGATPYLSGLTECDGRLLAILELDRLLNAPALRAFAAE